MPARRPVTARRAAARAEIEAIIADAQRRVADFWAGTGHDYQAAAAVFGPAMRAEAAGTAYDSREAS